MRKIKADQLHEEMRAQAVSAREHIAFVCPVCKTVQSIAALTKAGVSADDAEGKYIGFSCIGRFTNAGPWKSGEAPGRGCDWTLGGLFHIHELEVETPDGKIHKSFELATPDQAKQLESQLKGESDGSSAVQGRG